MGVVFGLLNGVTWFLVSPTSWWMGVLHVPLLVISTFLTITSWREPIDDARAARAAAAPPSAGGSKAGAGSAG